MSPLHKLVACSGNWRGTNRLHDPTTNAPHDSPSTASLTPLLGGKFIRFDYTWVYHGDPQEGSLLIGYDSGPALATAHWIDTWHMGERVMACAGTSDADGAIDVQGTYAAPPGPDWGWRIELRPGPGEALQLVMHNIHPDGGAMVAVEAEYRRA